MSELPLFSKKRSLLAACLIASVGVHLLGLFVFSKYNLSLEPHIQALFGMRSNPSMLSLNAEEQIEKLEKEKLLKEVFEELVLSQNIPYDAGHKFLNDSLEEVQAANATLLPALDVDFSSSLAEQSPLSIADLPDVQISVLEEGTSATLASIQSNIPKNNTLVALNLAQLTDGLIDELDEIDSYANSPTDALHIAKIQDIEIVALAVESEKKAHPDDFSIPSSAPRSPLIMPKQERIKLDTAKSVAATSQALPNSKHYNLSDSLPGVSWSRVFEADLEIMPDKQESRYVFSLTLTPIKNLSEMRIKQNFYFLIDRSSSIEKHRFTTFKKGALRALASLQEGDTFNIVILDQKIAHLSEHNLPFTPESLLAAEEFLDKQDHGGFFAVADLYTSLQKVIPATVLENEVNTAILISDGNTLLKSQKQQKSINQWMQKNGDAFSLYTAAVGMDNNLTLLDLLSSLNRGRLLHSDTHAAFPRRLAKLVLDLRNPLAKEMTIDIKAKDPDVEIHTFPAANRLAYLHDKQPYVILGTMDQLTDLDISIQAKSDEGWITIDKKIQFENAKKGSTALTKLWAAERAHERYEKFLQEGKTAYLDEAKALLETVK